MIVFNASSKESTSGRTPYMVYLNNKPLDYIKVKDVNIWEKTDCAATGIAFDETHMFNRLVPQTYVNSDSGSKMYEAWINVNFDWGDVQANIYMPDGSVFSNSFPGTGIWGTERWRLAPSIVFYNDSMYNTMSISSVGNSDWQLWNMDTNKQETYGTHNFAKGGNFTVYNNYSTNCLNVHFWLNTETIQNITPYVSESMWYNVEKFDWANYYNMSDATDKFSFGFTLPWKLGNNIHLSGDLGNAANKQDANSVVTTAIPLLDPKQPVVFDDDTGKYEMSSWGYSGWNNNSPFNEGITLDLSHLGYSSTVARQLFTNLGNNKIRIVPNTQWKNLLSTYSTMKLLCNNGSFIEKYVGNTNVNNAFQNVYFDDDIQDVHMNIGSDFNFAWYWGNCLHNDNTVIDNIHYNVNVGDSKNIMIINLKGNNVYLNGYVGNNGYFTGYIGRGGQLINTSNVYVNLSYANNISAYGGQYIAYNYNGNLYGNVWLPSRSGLSCIGMFRSSETVSDCLKYNGTNLSLNALYSTYYGANLTDIKIETQPNSITKAIIAYNISTVKNINCYWQGSSISPWNSKGCNSYQTYYNCFNLISAPVPTGSTNIYYMYRNCYNLGWASSSPTGCIGLGRTNSGTGAPTFGAFVGAFNFISKLNYIRFANSSANQTEKVMDMWGAARAFTGNYSNMYYFNCANYSVQTSFLGNNDSSQYLNVTIYLKNNAIFPAWANGYHNFSIECEWDRAAQSSNVCAYEQY